MFVQKAKKENFAAMETTEFRMNQRNFVLLTTKTTHYIKKNINVYLKTGKF
jgi:hypothetical protein